MQRIPNGVTDQYVYFKAVDEADLITPETGLSGFTVRRSRNGGASAAMTTPTINETDSSNMPGMYELLMDEDTSLDSGDDSQVMALHIECAGMADVDLLVEIYRPPVTAGETLTVASGVASANVAQVNGIATVATTLARLFGFTGCTGTADSGTTTTMVDAALTQATADHFKGMAILFSGSGSAANHGIMRLITGFDPATDTVTFYPAANAAITTETYVIVPWAMVDLWGLLGTVMAAPTVAGVPEVDVTHWLGTAAQGASGRPQVDVELIEGADPSDTIRDAVVDDATRIDASALNTVSGTTIPAIDGKTTNLPTDPADQSLIIAATDALAALIGTPATDLAADIAAVPTADENADALLDRSAGVETGLTVRQAFRLFASVLLGKASGLATTTAVYRDTGDAKDRVTATVDADGNRTAVTLDPS